MSSLEVGRVCIKTKGREAGKKAVIVELEKGFALIDGEGIRRRKCNPRHLFPTGMKIGISKGAKHEEVIKLMK